MTAIAFALSCFGLLLFLWLSFGGPVPLQPQSYRFTADFAEAITLPKQADVRLGGVTVGKVKELELPDDVNATRATIELEPEFAPLSSDARAILRQKTLVGEAYIELTGGTGVRDVAGDQAVDPLPEGARLPSSQVQDSVQIDEIFNALDERTRTAFRVFQQNLAIGSKGRGTDLSDAFGNLGPFSSDAARILRTLNRQGDALSSVINSTGEVFQALTQRDAQLAGLIQGNNRTFGALASRDQALAESIKIFPTFNAESRKLLTRLQSFAVNARPLARDLKPVARDLSPTLKDLRRLAPHAKSLFTNLDPLITASLAGLPQTRGIIRELKPTLEGLDPFLANFNPILRYISGYSGNVTDFIANPSAGIAMTLPQVGPQPTGRHALRQIGLISPESLSIFPTRQATNRGNGYLPPHSIGSLLATQTGGIFPNHDCDNTMLTAQDPAYGSGQVTPNSSNPATPTPPNTFAGSNPAATPGIFPGTINGSFPLSEYAPTGPVKAFAPCTLLPSPFGGGAVPYVPRDP